MGEIVWLASYPRSGNTWLRALLSNYLQKAQQAVDINSLQGTYVSSRSFFDRYAGLEASNLLPGEILKARPRVCSTYARACNGIALLKIHDAFSIMRGFPEVLTQDSKAIIYLIRNPFDVAVSLAHFLGLTLDQSIHGMADQNGHLADNMQDIGTQLPQLLSSWSNHVIGWVDNEILPVHVMRYEDMLADAYQTFRKVVEVISDHVDDDMLQAAIKFSSFSSLQAQEEEHGFFEGPLSAKTFFRQGKAGAWRDVLTPEQRERIIAGHREVMMRFGYLSEAGEILC